MTVGGLAVDWDRHHIYIQRTVMDSPKWCEQEETLKDRVRQAGE